jgi:hypothetical protein
MVTERKVYFLVSSTLLLLLIMGTVTAVGLTVFKESPTAEPVEQSFYTYLPVVLVARTPVIHYFRASVEIADPGDTIQLEWDTSNATEVTLYHLMPSGQLGQFWDVPPTGVFTYTIGLGERNHTDFILFAGNEEGAIAGASVSITLACPDEWFFAPAPDICPATAAIISDGAEQPFEHGLMLWVAGENMVYVLFDDGQSPHWMSYTDHWEEGDPVNDPTIIPPPGFYQPERGFGLVWREEASVRDRLGWATETESGYETAVQRTSYSRYNSTYIRAADANVWWLKPEFSGWEKLNVEP